MPVVKAKRMRRWCELCYVLVSKELKLKYRNSVIGFFWSLLKPLLMMVVFSVVFGVLFKREWLIGGIKYPFSAVLIIGLFPWMFFANAQSYGCMSVVNNAALIRKVYFPRVILPVSSVMANAVDFVLSLLVLFPVLFVIQGQVLIGSSYLLLPAAIALEFFLALGLALIVATVNVFFRDTSHILEVLLMAWFYLSPVLYPLDFVREGLSDRSRLMSLYEVLNPMVSVLRIYRKIVLMSELPEFRWWLIAAVWAVIMLVSGWLLFYRFEDRFVERA